MKSEDTDVSGGVRALPFQWAFLKHVAHSHGSVMSGKFSFSLELPPPLTDDTETNFLLFSCSAGVGLGTPAFCFTSRLHSSEWKGLVKSHARAE